MKNRMRPALKETGSRWLKFAEFDLIAFQQATARPHTCAKYVRPPIDRLTTGVSKLNDEVEAGDAKHGERVQAVWLW